MDREVRREEEKLEAGGCWVESYGRTRDERGLAQAAGAARHERWEQRGSSREADEKGELQVGRAEMRFSPREGGACVCFGASGRRLDERQEIATVGGRIFLLLRRRSAPSPFASHCLKFPAQDSSFVRFARSRPALRPPWGLPATPCDSLRIPRTLWAWPRPVGADSDINSFRHQPQTLGSAVDSRLCVSQVESLESWLGLRVHCIPSNRSSVKAEKKVQSLDAV